MVQIDKIIVVGDRVLIRPTADSQKSHGGLYLPPSVAEKEKVQSGYIIKVGPGYPIASPTEDEPWKENNPTKYIPLQSKEGDLALYLKKDAIEIELNKEKLVIVPHSSIVLLLREDDNLEF
ncbi:MAG: co-chaperone GroES family protein [Bacteroidetes bacterium]|nr:co-chaperone GroES family protein [Bacteroidota bacterium]MBU1678722.1 co-chaperone GroES family protein [Bacteroidota bacterium]MBU2507500.1 co-chaperone GroES family protein [Bacteroidota bacterium]